MDAVLAAAQEEAQHAEAGMWAPAACGPESEGSITIDAYVYDAPGNDNFNLNEEWVRFRNTGASTLDLTGWSVKDESATHRYQFASGFTLASGATVTLYTGCGDDTATDLYWCNTGSAIWNNSGDTIFVLDPNGNVVVSESY